MAKAMKPSKEDRLAIRDDAIYIINPEFSIMKRMICDPTGIRFTNNYNNMVKFMASNYDFVVGENFDITGTASAMQNQTYYDVYIDKFIEKIYFCLEHRSMGPPKIYDMRENQTFNETLSKNIIYGVAPVQFDEYIMFLSGTMLPINKADKCTVAIHDLGEFMFMSVFTVLKPKIPPIDIFMTFRKLI
jgi:hypothetical protein